MTREPQRDGRRERSERTRAALIAAARRQMAAGNFRPGTYTVVLEARCSARTLFQHFPTLESLYIAAIDPETAHAMVNRLPVHDEIALARVLATGRVIP